MKASLVVLLCVCLSVASGQVFPPQHYTQQQANPFGFKTPEGDPPQLEGAWTFERWVTGSENEAPATLTGLATFKRRLETNIVDQYRLTIELADANGEEMTMEAYVNLCKGTYMIDGPWVLIKDNKAIDAGYLIYLLQERGPLHYEGDFKFRLMGGKGTDMLTMIPSKPPATK